MTGRIMIVEGVQTSRIVLKVRLMGVGHQVATRASGDEALESLLVERPRIVIIGTQLPDLDPVELCRRLRATPDFDETPILMMTSPEARLAALNAGASAVIDPSDSDQVLFARIRRLLCQTAAHWDDGGEPAPRRTGLPRVTLIADRAGTALAWRHALQARLDCDYQIDDPVRALTKAHNGPASDLYLIDCDLTHPCDGLRLLSELRSRRYSRDAAFIVALRPERQELAPVALDLGAADVVPHSLAAHAIADEVALRLRMELSHKFTADRDRRQAQRNQIWAMTDALTGLHNRRYAHPRLEEMLHQTAGPTQSLAILTMDLDRFKAVNDHFGHAAGDQVLVTFARRMREVFPREALTARTGGEEFLAAFPVRSAERAQVIAESLRNMMDLHPVELDCAGSIVPLPMTVSLGMAIVGGDNTPVPSLAQLLSRADRALLMAKAGGRNRLVLADRALAA